MRNLSRRQKNNIIIGGLLAIVAIMAIGYAAFASQLKINGTSNISSTWDVRITGIESELHGATNAVEPTYDNTNGLTASFSTNLTSPGDYAEYTITVENQGSIDAKLDKITVSDSSNPAIEFETSGIKEGALLAHGEKDELYVKVTYSDSVTSQPGNTTSKITVTLDFLQAEAGYVPPAGGSTAADMLIAQVTDSGDGLYADTYEDGRYVYKGANPNNYITFNDEIWRIISVEADGSIKIMKNESIGKMEFDKTEVKSNAWERSDIRVYLEGKYLTSIQEKTPNDYAKIVPHTWSIGAVTYDNNDLADQISDENGTQSQPASVGMITLSEYLRANTNTAQCGSLSLNNNNYSTCKTTDWMFNIVSSGDDSFTKLWTISPAASSGTTIFAVYGNGFSAAGSVVGYYVGNSVGVSPVLYLSSDFTLTGDGSVGTPYVIS